MHIDPPVSDPARSRPRFPLMKSLFAGVCCVGLYVSSGPWGDYLSSIAHPRGWSIPVRATLQWTVAAGDLPCIVFLLFVLPTLAQRSHEPLGLDRLTWPGIRIAALGVIAAVISTVLYITAYRYIFHVSSTPATVHYFTGFTPLDIAVAVATLCGITPFAEELFFRGLLLNTIISWMPKSFGILLTSFIFAAAHRSPADFGAYFLIGLILSTVYLRTRSLTCSIFTHAGINIIHTITLLTT